MKTCSNCGQPFEGKTDVSICDKCYIDSISETYTDVDGKTKFIDKRENFKDTVIKG